MGEPIDTLGPQASRPRVPNIHTRLTAAGWSYRTNTDRGWIVYRDPETRKWHTTEEAAVILEARSAGASPDSQNRKT